jgi:hypothetical protein
MRPFSPVFALCLFAAATAGAQPPNTPVGLSPEDADLIQRKSQALSTRLKAAEGTRKISGASVADAAVFLKGVDWALRYEPTVTPADVALIKKALDRCEARLKSIESGARPWTAAKGRLARGYKSEVDGSYQPYGLIVPQGYTPGKPIRLDVVLHGSTRPVGMSELRFMNGFDAGDLGAAGPNASWIELHPLGRVENCYRWAGEADVFEAIEDVCKDYSIDRDRIVLRGMSMGASGTWHLGLKRPDRFVALGPYCGYVDTHVFSMSPFSHFIKVGPLPEHQEQGLHMLDSIDYAANGGVVPCIACMGEKDVNFDEHERKGNAFHREALELTNLISNGTGHVIDPVIQGEQLARIGDYAAKGLDRSPARLRFVTWTLKYPEAHWVKLLGLERHYARAQFVGRLEADKSVRVEKAENITRFQVQGTALSSAGSKLFVGDAMVFSPEMAKGKQTGAYVFEKRDGRWTYAGRSDSVHLTGKRPGVQGPIDDAFAAPFLCVRGTGKPWNPLVQQWADVSLKRFAYEWSRYMRGDLPVKDDKDVTDLDVGRYNLICFGDPGSNRWIKKALPKLPLKWSRETLEFRGGTYASGRHAPALITSSPFPGITGKYLVINSGHTFHEPEFSTLNYLLFPRLGDWAVMKVGAPVTGNPSEAVREEPIVAGYFDEQWK